MTGEREGGDVSPEHELPSDDSRQIHRDWDPAELERVRQETALREAEATGEHRSVEPVDELVSGEDEIEVSDKTPVPAGTTLPLPGIETTSKVSRRVERIRSVNSENDSNGGIRMLGEHEQWPAIYEVSAALRDFHLGRGAERYSRELPSKLGPIGTHIKNDESPSAPRKDRTDRR